MDARADGQISAIIVAPRGPGPPGAALKNNLERPLAFVPVLVVRNRVMLLIFKLTVHLMLVSAQFIRNLCSVSGPPGAADACGGDVSIRSYAYLRISTAVAHTEFAIYGDPSKI